MWNKITIAKKEIDCNSTFSQLKETIYGYMQEDESFLENAKMKCEVIIEGGLWEFDSGILSIILAFAALYLSIFKSIEQASSYFSLALFAFGLILIVLFSINLHMRKQNALKIKYVINSLENTPPISQQSATTSVESSEEITQDISNSQAVSQQSEESFSESISDVEC